MGTQKIIDVLVRTNSLIKLSGYAKILKWKILDINSYELEELYDYALCIKNLKGCSALNDTIIERGVCYEYERGKIHRNY